MAGVKDLANAVGSWPRANKDRQGFVVVVVVVGLVIVSICAMEVVSFSDEDDEG